MIGVMSVFAQLEREVIIERLRDGQHKMIQEKRVMGWRRTR